jgi:hypothetical protein
MLVHHRSSSKNIANMTLANVTCVALACAHPPLEQLLARPSMSARTNLLVMNVSWTHADHRVRTGVLRCR